MPSNLTAKSSVKPPSAGAMAAARAIKGEGIKQKVLLPLSVAETAQIIDRETGAAELVETLREIENLTRAMAGNPHWEAIAQDIQQRARTSLSRHA